MRCSGIHITFNVLYKEYWSMFTQAFNIKFGFPRSGTCSICDTLAIKINNPECSTEERKKLETETKVQNLPLPHLKTNAVFIAVNCGTMCLVLMTWGSDSVTMFTYHEGDGRKGSNKYINNNNEPVDNLVLIRDSCCGQNKNQTIVHFLFTLVHCFHVFITVTYLFPVRGHSYLPNTQDFSLIDRKKLHNESVELPEE
ncbi:hypothetical protein PR048_009807 [Dryococelus australis]|uniref:Uncharacterized protein n=1 Tax=Dryococelus australis TaxID=614101 RepID=A0ABQ9I107_9NEOP|nr:hypothetical protein PR048_009807 [Dryococelus australis]